TVAKFGSVDRGFVASIVGGGVGVDCCGGGVKDVYDYGMTMVNIGEDSVLTETGLDSEQDTDGSESDSESDQQEYEEEVKDDDEDDKSKDIHPNDVEIFSPLDVDVHHEVPRIHTSTLLTVPVSVIPKASPDVTELKKDPLHTQVTALVDDHLDTRIGAAREEFINFLSESLTARNKAKKTRIKMKSLSLDQTECLRRERQAKMQIQQQALLEKLDWENPEADDYPFDLSKPLPLITHGKRQRVPVEFFINNDLKYLKGGISTMTYMTSTSKTKAVQYDLPGIEDMREQRKSFYAYARGMQSRGDVYFTKLILAVTHVSIMRKHGYGYLEEIVNRLTNLSGDDVDALIIALRMFTRSLVIQKRVEDLQLGVESYQKQINVTKPDTTIPDLRKGHPYTPYKDPQGFIYVDDYKRNRLMCSDELYKFSDGMLTRLLFLLEDITKNIDMEYLPKIIWSTLEKKRAHFMIKDINKLLKERRKMRSLEKFVGGRLYETDLRLLQRTI
nr:hypothetical protein [Tanacetum cinerariifolium]